MVMDIVAESEAITPIYASRLGLPGRWITQLTENIPPGYFFFTTPLVGSRTLPDTRLVEGDCPFVITTIQGRVK